MWISVKERLPEIQDSKNPKYIPVKVKGLSGWRQGFYSVSWHVNVFRSDIIMDCLEVTHYYDLPEPPEGVE